METSTGFALNSAAGSSLTAETGARMRALLQSAYGTVDVLEERAIERPQAGPREVIVQVRAAGLDRGTWHLMTGRPYLMRLMGFGFFRPKQAIAGRDVAGVVVEVGPGVSRLRVGDAVFGTAEGSFAEFARAREETLAHKPANFSFEQAAVAGVSGMTALQACEVSGVAPGDRVLIIGASGGVGTFAVQVAKALGAEVTGVCSSGKVEAVRSLGAAHVIDYTKQDFADGSRTYDVILDVGGNTPVARLRRALTETGRLVFVGGENGDDFTAGFGRQLGAFALAPFVKQRFFMLMAREHFESLERLAALIAAGKIVPLVDRRCPLSQVPRAIEDLEAGKVCGKIVVTVGA